MKYGLEHETDAAQCYVNTQFVYVYWAGFVINPGCPYLGATPDFLVYDPSRNEVFGLLKIKCLQCDSWKGAKCLKIINGQLTLKRTHEYYFQVMRQMAITGLQWCDFMVFCKTDWHIETIFFDEEFLLTCIASWIYLFIIIFSLHYNVWLPLLHNVYDICV